MPSTGACISAKLSRMKGFGFREYQYGERGSVGDAQLPINMVQVDLHCTLGQPEPAPDFPVGCSLGDREHDLALADRERLRRPMSSFCYFSHVEVLDRMSLIVYPHLAPSGKKPNLIARPNVSLSRTRRREGASAN